MAPLPRQSHTGNRIGKLRSPGTERPTFSVRIFGGFGLPPDGQIPPVWAYDPHLQTVDRIRAIARRAGEGAWRLIGLAIRIDVDAQQATLEEFIEQRELDGWSRAEVVAMYQETYPVERRAKYRNQRRTELRQRQLDLIKRLEKQSAEAPCPTDLVTGWFDELLAKRLLGAGLTSLADLNAQIATGGRWYRSLPSIGEAKAGRIAAHLATLLPRAVRPARALFVLSRTPNLFAAPSPAPQRQLAAPARLDAPLPSPTVIDAAQGYPNKLTLAPATAKSENFVGVGDGQIEAALPASAAPSLLKARNDLEAVDAWIAARSGSIHTARAYQREANRLLLWLQYERGGKRLPRWTLEIAAITWPSCRPFRPAGSPGFERHPASLVGRRFAGL